MPHKSGRHFLQVPGPTNVPDRVLRAIDRPTIDHRSAEFAALTRSVLSGLKEVFGAATHVFIYPGSATGGWEAALVNTLSPGDRVLMFDNGFFAANWCRAARRLSLDVDLVSCDWRRPIDAVEIEARLHQDSRHRYKAVLIVHNETSTGVTSSVLDARRAIERAEHPALLMVDTVSSVGSLEFHHDDWGIDVTVAGSQKGLMLPPGLAFNAVSAKALAAREQAKLPRSYWDWSDHLAFNAQGFFPYTPSTNLLFGLQAGLDMLREEGLAQVWARHERLATAARRAVEAWGLELYCQDAGARSHTITAALMPDGYDADTFRELTVDRFDMSLGAGLGKLKGKVFRIGHLGHFNDLMLAGTLAGIEMGLIASGMTSARGGITAALDYLAATSEAAGVR